MTHPATSSSGRYTALRHALDVAEYRAEHHDANGFALVGSVERSEFLFAAVKEFLAVTPVAEEPERIAARIWRSGHSQAIEACENETLALLASAVQAGIQAAWESWEPADWPPIDKQGIADALNGDSNDAEHEELWAIAEALGMTNDDEGKWHA